MAGRFLDTNEFTLDELKGKAVNANTRNSCFALSRVLCVGEELAEVILSCI